MIFFHTRFLKILRLSRIQLLSLTDRAAVPFRRSIEENSEEEDRTLADLTEKMNYQLNFLE